MDGTLGRLVLIALGGGLGAVGRYGLDLAIQWLWPALTGRFPLGTLLVNVLGCFAIGWLMAGQMLTKVVLSAVLVPPLIYLAVAIGRRLDAGGGVRPSA